MQNCEKTETNLQVMTKGNQIKNFSKKRLKTPNWWKLKVGMAMKQAQVKIFDKRLMDLGSKN